jgi:hypothetical protein
MNPREFALKLPIKVKKILLKPWKSASIEIAAVNSEKTVERQARGERREARRKIGISE